LFDRPKQNSFKDSIISLNDDHDNVDENLEENLKDSVIEPIIVITSRKNRAGSMMESKKLCAGGYCYIVHRKSESLGQIEWNCERKSNTKQHPRCSGRAMTLQKEFHKNVKIVSPHNHRPEAHRQALLENRKKLKTGSLSSDDLHRAVELQSSNELAVLTPNNDVVDFEDSGDFEDAVDYDNVVDNEDILDDNMMDYDDLVDNDLLIDNVDIDDMVDKDAEPVILMSLRKNRTGGTLESKKLCAGGYCYVVHRESATLGQIEWNCERKSNTKQHPRCSGRAMTLQKESHKHVKIVSPHNHMPEAHRQALLENQNKLKTGSLTSGDRSRTARLAAVLDLSPTTIRKFS
jgi:uncharacterized protein YheU (UPF0270 family)